MPSSDSFSKTAIAFLKFPSPLIKSFDLEDTPSIPKDNVISFLFLSSFISSSFKRRPFVFILTFILFNKI